MKLLHTVIIFLFVFIISCPVFANKTVDIHWTKFSIPDELKKNPEEEFVFESKDNSRIQFVLGEKHKPNKKLQDQLNKDRKNATKDFISGYIPNTKAFYKQRKLQYEHISGNDLNINEQQLVFKLIGKVSKGKNELFILVEYFYYYKGDLIIITAQCDKKLIGKYEKIFDDIVKSMTVKN